MIIYTKDNNILLIIITCFIASALLVPIVKKIAIYIGAMDEPNERKVHKISIPRIGGLAIFFAFIFGFIMFCSKSEQMISILIGGMLTIFVGIIDDIKPIKAKYKLLGQIIVALIVVFYGKFYFNDFSFLGIYVSLGYFKYIVTIFFVVSMMNCINLIDGLDGLAAGISSIYFSTILLIAILLKSPMGFDIAICAIMLGSILGFLLYNFNPAKIFMGDTGSLFIGYMVAIVSLMGYKTATITTIFIPIIIMGIPILDTLFAIIRRVLNGESIGHADKQHLHHQLLRLSKSVRVTVILIYLISLLFSSLAVFYVLKRTKILIIITAIIFLLIFVLIIKTNIIFKKSDK